MNALEITPIIPVKEGPLEFEELDVMVEGSDVNIIEDSELDLREPQAVIELLGKESKMRILANCTRPYLSLHFKTLRRFMFIDVLCFDSNGMQRELRLSNKTSFVTIDKNVCSLPFQTAADGWQYAMLDLEDLLANAFACQFHSCAMITLSGTIRISKLFFQSKRYSDIELPNFLRVAQTTVV
jgi:hypothetical protein